MIILGIDPGLIRTGFGILLIKNDELKLLDYGIVEPNKNDDLSVRLYTISSDIVLVSIFHHWLYY